MVSRKSPGKLFIGTSGFSYSHWEDGVFYPKGLAKTKQLEYYAKHFQTVELNNPFYRLPSVKTFSSWRERTPKGFIFSVKVSRYITHIKYLRQCKAAWKTFLERAEHLESKLGPFLFQLPPNWHKNLDRLENFLKLLGEKNKKHRYVFEFRHPSWFFKDTYNLFKKYKNISLCLADSPRWPFKEIITGDFIYIRMHGGKILYGSNYSKKELKQWGEKIKKWLKKKLDVYIYFNNDVQGFAVKNAKLLKKILNI